MLFCDLKKTTEAPSNMFAPMLAMINCSVKYSLSIQV